MSVLFPGDSTAVRRALASTYGPHGFTVDQDLAIPTILTSRAYTMRVVIAPRDHSPNESNVIVQLTRRRSG